MANWKPYSSFSSEEKAKAIARATAWNKAHPEERRVSKYKDAIRRRYGLTPYQQEILMLCQGGTCGICGIQIEIPGDLHVDHNHETGAIRGLLCKECNLGLGKLKEVNITKALDYIRGK